MNPQVKNLSALALFILASIITAATGTQFEPGEWYEQLNKPSWTPPNYAFPIAWSFLYLAMAVAAWLVWCKAGFKKASNALALHGLQLISNAAWSWLMFGMHEIRASLLNLTFLWATVATMMFLFWRIRPLAGALQVPYLLWLSYAWSLNFAIWYLNPV
jgi:tryptophan-rich sensory protein